MKPFKNYNEAREKANFSGSAKLPAGAYVCKVLGVKYEEGENGFSDRIAIQFDVAEGEQKDFFKDLYENNSAEDKKWKGATRIYVPKDDGTERDGWTTNAFAKWTAAFEESNNGYTWDWNEQTWKGLLVGIVFGETGTNINGKDIIYTEARFPIATSKVRSGKAPEARFKTKGDYGKAAALSNDFIEIPEGSPEEIPF